MDARKNAKSDLGGAAHLSACQRDERCATGDCQRHQFQDLAAGRAHAAGQVHGPLQEPLLTLQMQSFAGILSSLPSSLC